MTICIMVSAQGIEFEHTPWKEALDLAKQEGKPLFVDSYATWCGPCKRMAKKVFTKESVGKFFNENFINLKLDMEKEDGVTFGHKYPVSAYPTLYFLGGDGNVIIKERGAKSEEDLLNIGEMVLRKYDTSGQFAEEYEKGNRDYDLVYKYIKALNKASKPTLKISNDYLRSEPDITEEQRLAFIFEAAVESDSKIFDELVQHKKEIRKLMSEEEYQNRIERATNATVDKAIEYEVESLLDDALEAYKNALDDDEVAALKMKRRYYLNTGNKSEYLALSERLFKKVKKDKDQLKRLLKDLMSNSVDPRFNELLEKTADQLIKVDDSEENIMEYAKLMIKLDQIEKAEKAIDKKLKDLEGDDAKSKNLQRMKKYIERTKA